MYVYRLLFVITSIIDVSCLTTVTQKPIGRRCGNVSQSVLMRVHLFVHEHSSGLFGLGEGALR
jgi:hypothetical protein